MELKKLRELVSYGEGEYLEFKKKVADPVKIVREIVAFVNHKGGKLLIGVDDDGTISGLKYAEEEAYELEAAIVKHCKPAINFTLHVIKISAKRSVLVYDIQESKRKPVYLIYNFRRKLGKAYIRVSDKSVQTSREVRKVLQAQTKNQDGHFMYGQHEQALMRCFVQSAQVNLQSFAQQAGISIETASDILIRLTVANVLEVHPTDSGDYFTMKDTNGLPH